VEDGTPSGPLVIAHRGASAYAPENTIGAFQMALDVGADGIEFDVQLARDGIPVVIHDDKLKRTGGRNEGVVELTSRQLGEIDVGSWFNVRHPKRSRDEFGLETVPTLERVLTSLAGFDGLIYIELKCNVANFRPLVDVVAQIIGSSRLLPQIIVQSFHLTALPEMASMVPEVLTAGLFEPSVKVAMRRRARIIAIAREFGARQLSVHRSLVTPKLMSLATDAGMPVSVWTVDSPKWIGRSQKLGIAALITNDPAKMLAARHESHRGLKNGGFVL
jgi:glycerophosphoryl diester phosphodiesterase